MADDKLTPEAIRGSQKAAVFLLNMGEEYASQIFSQMTDNEIRMVASAMAKIDQIPPNVLQAVTDDFLEKFEGDAGLVVQGDVFAKKVIGAALAGDQAQSIVNEIESGKQDVPFIWSRNINTSTLAGYFEGEHPQTAAMVLAHLPPEVASEVMVNMPDDKKGDIALRIANLGQVPEEIIREVDEALRSDLINLGSSGAKADGLQVLVDILNGVDKSTEETILELIEEENNDMASEIRDMMFVFEDMVSVDDRAMREILKKVESPQLTYALKTASEEMRQKIFGNLSTRASEMLKEDLEAMGPVRLSEVEEAQQAIVRAAKGLEAEGAIVLGGKGKEDLLV